MTDLDAEALKILRDYLVKSEARLYDHVATTFRWLMATLFAANGGAILAILDQHGSRKASAIALAWFASGLIFSIAMGIASGFVSYRAVVRLETARLQIDECLLTGANNQKVLEDFVARNQISWKTWTPSYFGVASFACLIVGILMFASRLR